MKLTKILKMAIPARWKIYINKIFYLLSPFSFAFRFENDLNSLKNKLNLYFLFFSSQKKIFSNELDFIINKAVKDNIWSFVFPYSFVFNYNYDRVDVYRDNKNGLFYVLHNGRRLYYSRQYQTETDVRKAYINISIEQDEKSPHRYLAEQFNVKEKDVVADVGAAEGNFSLDVVERAGYLYIFENDINWIEALNASFEPWKEKVQIINKFISDNDDEQSSTLDHFLGDRRIDLIKIDVEGAEIQVLKGSEEVLINNPSLKMLICTYHRKKDARTIGRILDKHGFTYAFSNGYMLFIYDTLTPPYFRRVLIRAQK